MNLDWTDIEKILNNTASDSEIAQFEMWLSESKSHQDQFQKMKSYYADFEKNMYNREQVHDQHYTPKQIITSHRRMARNRFVKWSAAATAAVILLVAVTKLFTPNQIPLSGEENTLAAGTEINSIQIQNESGEVIALGSLNKEGVEVDADLKLVDYSKNITNQAKIEYHTLCVPAGERFMLELSDGTIVNLNANTKIKYPTKFEPGKPRKVILSGEAYFEVKHDDKSQFVVTADNVNIKVYGTQFNLNTHNPAIETVLISGSVAVEINGKERKIVPNQKATVNRNSGAIQIENVDVQGYILWTKDYLTFENKKLVEIAAILSKCYNVEIVFANETAEKLVINCNLPKYSNVELFLNELKKTNRINYHIEGDKYIIR